MTEQNLQNQIIEYLKLKYKNVLFKADLNGIKLTIGQAIKAAKQKSNRGFPDIEILKTNSKYCGLFIEVKKCSPFKKNGQLKNDIHILEQYELHLKLKEQRYISEFAWTFEMARKIIDDYMKIL